MLLYHNWLQLSLSTRVKIASAFGIEKKGATEVFHNEIKSDGYLIKDVESALNLVALQKHLGTTEVDSRILWDMLVAKTEGRALPVSDLAQSPSALAEPAPLPAAIVSTAFVDDKPKKKMGRPKGSKNKNAKSN